MSRGIASLERVRDLRLPETGQDLPLPEVKGHDLLLAGLAPHLARLAPAGLSHRLAELDRLREAETLIEHADRVNLVHETRKSESKKERRRENHYQDQTLNETEEVFLPSVKEEPLPLERQVETKSNRIVMPETEDMSRKTETLTETEADKTNLLPSLLQTKRELQRLISHQGREVDKAHRDRPQLPRMSCLRERERDRKSLLPRRERDHVRGPL